MGINAVYVNSNCTNGGIRSRGMRSAKRRKPNVLMKFGWRGTNEGSWRVERIRVWRAATGLDGGVKVASGSRGMTLGSARKIGWCGEPWCICR